MPEFPAIVITGVGFVTPLGHTPDQLLQAMRQCQSGIGPVVLDDVLPILMGCVSQNDFPYHPGDRTIDFAISSARDAWQQSGLSSTNIDPWQVATVIGSSKGRLGNLLCLSGGHARAIDPMTFPGNTLGLSVASDMAFRGPVLNYPAACATGIHCMIRAAQLLQNGEADIALAGSGEANGKALVMASFMNMGALSKDKIRPFDVRRSGFNPGEGAAVFVLERETDAQARGANVLARIAGWDQRSDAHHITSAEPSGQTVAYSISRTLSMAAWNKDDVEYINAHGTGTTLNDVVEGRAIRLAFGHHSPLVSSIKPNIGHLLGASSAVELAVALTCLRDGFIPPTLGLEQPDPDIPLHFVPPGGSNQPTKRFMKLSLGFGGHIGVLAVELP